MTNHQSMIDAALEKAKARMGTKVASVSTGGGILKEAEEVANALEYIAYAAVNDGTPAGVLRSAMVNSFFKGAANGDPAAGATTTTGTQAQVPDGSDKKIQPGGTPGAKDPSASASLDGKQPTDILRTMPPGTAPTPTGPSGKKTANMTLYDILMSSKIAAMDGPLSMDADQALPQTPEGGDGKAFADKILGSNSAPVEATKREAKLPTRARLAEVWGQANNTLSQQSAQAVAPKALAAADIKVASLVRAFHDERGKEAAIAFTQAGHEYQKGRGKAEEKAHGTMAKADREYAAKSPVLALLGGQHVDALGQSLASRHGAYKAKKHGEGRQSLNPFGGWLTPTEGEKKGAWAITSAGHKLEAERGKAEEELGTGVRRAAEKYSKASPLGAMLLGHHGEAVGSRLMARHGAYKARKHGDERQSLNPFGGWLTATEEEKKGSAELANYSELFHKMAQGELGEEMKNFAQAVDGTK